MSERMIACTALYALLWGGCDAQATPSYSGQALLALSGSVEIDSQRERGKLMPALAFYNSDTGEFHLMDLDVEGHFPSDFTLRVYDPPPAEAIVESPERPASTLAYLTAVTSDRPDVIRGASSRWGTGACAVAVGDGDSDSAGEPTMCETESEWCVKDGEDCYREHRSCPAIDSPIEDCEILSSSGDPALREDPWAKFAGLSDSHAVLYLVEALAADDPVAIEAGLPALEPGYHLFEMPTGDGSNPRRLCLEQANRQAIDEYNDAHSTTLEAGGAHGWGCAPRADRAPGQAPHDSDGSGPGDEEEPQEANTAPDEPSVDCSQIDEAEVERLRAEKALDCPPEEHLRVIENPADERISVRIGLDLAPKWNR